MGESLSFSSTKSDSNYTPYAVHVFPGGIAASDTLAPVQVNILNSDDPFSSCGTENLVKIKETNSSVTSHSHPSTLSKGMSHWDIHPSLKTLLGDLCSDHDVSEAVNNSRIEGFPSKQFDEGEDTDCPLSSALSHRLSIGAPEFVPSFLNPKLLSPSSGPDLRLVPDPYLALAPGEIAQVAITQLPSSTLTDKNEQCLRNKLNLMSDSVPRSRPQEYPAGKNIIENDISSCTMTEERNLISFDGDSLLISERSATPRHHPTDQHSFSSKDEQQSYTAASSLEESFPPERDEYAKENQFVSFEQNAHFGVPFLSQLTLTDRHSENNYESLHNAPEDVVSGGVQFYEQEEEASYQVPAETRQLRCEIPSARPLFKTYAEATNFYYSLLEGESREKLFQDSSSPQIPPIQPPGLTHPSLMHTSDRPNWAAAPDEDMNSSVRLKEHSRRSDRFNGSVSLAGESLVDIQGDIVARAPQSLDGNDFIGSGTNHFSDNNGYNDSRRDPGTYSPHALSDDRGDRNGKSYPDKRGFSSRSSNPPTYGSENLEREIDEYHENLRAKANRSSQQAQQSARAKNGNGSSNLRNVGHYDDLEREIDGYHDNLRAKANRSSQRAQLGSGRASTRNNGGGGNSGNGTASSSDNGKRGRDSSRRSLRGSGEDWVNNANWARTEKENGGWGGSNWGCE